MKKSVIKIIAFTLLAVALCVALVSCGKTLSGEYGAEMNLGIGKIEVVYNFKGSKVEIVFSVIGMNSDPIEASYEIKDDKITFDFADEDEIDNYVVKLLIEGMETPMDFEKTDDGIKIGVVEYKKAD